MKMANEDEFQINDLYAIHINHVAPFSTSHSHTACIKVSIKLTTF